MPCLRSLKSSAEAAAIAVAMCVLLSAMTASGGEGPQFAVSADAVRTIYTATPAASPDPKFKPHINFPWLTQRSDGSLVTWFTVGQTHGADVFGLSSTSVDGGDTWSAPARNWGFIPPVTLIKPAGQISRGFVIDESSAAGFSSWIEARYSSTDGGLSWSNTTASFNTAGRQYTSVYMNPGDVVETGSALLLSAFAQRPGSSTFESVLFASTDAGANWTRRSTVAEHVAGPNASMGEEGPNESDIIRLDNGDLLAVYRTGQPFPNSDVHAVHPSIFSSRSSDDGVTWSSPKMLGVMGAFPHLNKLSDGSIAMTYGRAGAKVMFADPTGSRWSFPTVIHDGPSSGYVRMRQRADGKFVFAFDHSSFYPPAYDSSPPPGYVYANDQMAHMKAAILTIGRQPAGDDYHWALEYHGDVTPDALPAPWTPSAQGTFSGYLWADQGQDYLRLDTGSGVGANNSFYYTLQAGDPSSAWARMSFAEGVVLETRARVGSAGTAEGSASLVLGDGEHGYVALEFTGASVGLEGLGGNGGQVSYDAAVDPGFTPLDWHEYRLVIAPDDATAGGGVLAKLYLDGDFVDPILTQQLNAAQLDSIYFGDLTGSNNGVFDVDYLRFASGADVVPEPDTAALAASFLLAWAARRRDRDRDRGVNAACKAEQFCFSFDRVANDAYVGLS